MPGLESFFIKFHLRERAKHGIDTQKDRQMAMIKSLELVMLLLKDSGFELWVEDSKGHTHRAEALVRYFLSGGTPERVTDSMPGEPIATQ